MRQLLARYGTALLISALLATGCTKAKIKALPVALQWQETSEWCWAASGQMIMNYRGPVNVPQCYEANQLFSRTDCCTSPTPNACINPGWPQFALWHFNSNATAWGTPLTWAQVQAQINGDKPFMFSWAWNGGGAHAMVANGYRDITFLGINTHWVVVNNPWPPEGRFVAGNASGPFGGDLEIITYAEFVGGAGYNHTHGADVYDVTHM